MTAIILDFAHAHTARAIGAPKRDFISIIRPDQMRHIALWGRRFQVVAGRSAGGTTSPIRVGDAVRVRGWRDIGCVTSITRDRALVGMPGIKVNVPLADLSLVGSGGTELPCDVEARP